MISFDEQTCLKINPFEGDFGSPGDKVLNDKIVTARGNAPCVECLTPTAKGERVRTMTAIFDGELHSYRWCAACCSASVAFFNDDYAPMNERAMIRAKAGAAMSAMTKKLPHQPKGSMCMACAHSSRDCSKLDFRSMPVMYRTDNAVTVKCIDYTPKTPPCQGHAMQEDA